MFTPYVLQWHITQVCNWRCKHCYHDTYENKNSLSFDEMKSVYDDFIALTDSDVLPEIVITGGEPLVHPDFFRLLEYVENHSKNVRITILTNGSLLNTENVEKMLKMAPSLKNIQISIEGESMTNDDIRGEGAFDAIICALDALTLYRSQVKTHLSFTLSRLNVQEIQKMLPLLLAYKIPLHIKRVVPLGLNKEKMSELLLSPQEMKEFYSIIHDMNNKYSFMEDDKKNPYLSVDWCVHGIDAASDTSQSLKKKRCAVLDKKLIVIMPNGDVYPCRLLPIKLGNVRNQSLQAIYNTDIFNQFTLTENRSEDCKKCSYFSRCQGGALCLSSAVYKDPFKKDPQCWR